LSIKRSPHKKVKQIAKPKQQHQRSQSDNVTTKKIIPDLEVDVPELDNRDMSELAVIINEAKRPNVKNVLQQIQSFAENAKLSK